MGGNVLRNEARWTAALHAGGRIHRFTASHHATTPDFAHHGRVLDQHICNLILTGSLLVVVGGQRRLLGPGGAVWINQGVPHDFLLGIPGRGFSMLNLRFRVRADSRDLGFAADVLLVDDAWDLRPLWELVVDDSHRRRDGWQPRFRHVLALLYGDLSRRATGTEENAGLGRHRRLALSAWIATRHHLRPSPTELARVVGLSADWFRRAFRRTFACSPRAWIVRERIRAAARRLAEQPGLAIADLATRFGYDDYRLFDRQFRAVMGASPRRWRQG